MSATEIHDDFIKTLGDKPPSYSTVKKRAAEFRRRRESVEVYGRSGRPKEAITDGNVKLVHSLNMGDRRRSLHDIAREVGISLGAIQSIFTDVQGFS